MKIYHLLIYLLGLLSLQALHPQQLFNQNIRAHYKSFNQRYTYEYYDPTIIIDYWVARENWNIPPSFKRSPIFQQIDDFLQYNARLIQHAFVHKKYNDALDVTANRFDWILFFFYQRPEFIEQLWFHKIKVITLNLAGLPLITLQAYKNPDFIKAGS